MEVAEEALRQKGFSEEAARRISQPQAESTLKNYQARWNVFCQWCAETDLDPYKVKSTEVAEFLLHQFHNKERAVKTIEGYRTAIASTLKHKTGVDLGQDLELSALLKSLQRERPRSLKTCPKWDLALVLFSLMHEPFEPLESISLKLLSFKTLFLLLLASGSRRGEIHALDFQRMSHAVDWSSVVLYPKLDFIAKTQLKAKGASALQPIKIPSLSRTLSHDLETDRKACPVRCLRAYIKRTQHMRKGKKLLLISYQEGKKTDICKNTISSWVKQLLRCIYLKANEDVSVLVGRTTHDIRAWAASFAFHENVSLEEILKACSWKSHTTFTDFYLRDISQVRDQVLELGPLVVAQNVVC